MLHIARHVTPILDVYGRFWQPRAFFPTLSLDLTKAPLDSSITFTRASIGTYFDAAGVLQTAASNVPRFDHDPVTGDVLGLLIEESRTNLVIESSAPATQNITVTAQAYTLSFYGAGNIVLSGAYSATLTGSGAFPTRSTLTFTPTAGTLTLTVSGTVQDAQLEAGSFETSYIQTTTASVTRAADLAKISNPDFVSADAGTVYAEFIPRQIVNNQEVVGLNAAAATPLTIDPITGRLDAYDGRNLTTTNAVTLGESAKAACSFTDTTKAVCLNGGNVSSGATNGTYPFLPISAIIIGSGTWSGRWTNGTIKGFQYYPQALTDAQLKSLTS